MMSNGMSPEDIMRQLRNQSKSKKSEKPIEDNQKEKETTIDLSDSETEERTKESTDEVLESQSVDDDDSVDEAVVDNDYTGESVLDDSSDITVESTESVQVNVNQHPEYTRERVKDLSDVRSATDRMVFEDIFVTVDGLVEYNKDHEKSVARNLSKGIINQLVDDLKREHEGFKVSMGDNYYTIDASNEVFVSITSLMRYLLLDKMENENLSLQLARQLFLEKHPDGESNSFDHKTPRTDERDIYAMLLSSKADPKRDLTEKLDEMIRIVRENDELLARSNAKVEKQTMRSNELLNGLNIGTSLLILERLGLTDGRLPRDLTEMRGFMSQDNILKLSDQLSNEIPYDVMKRRKVIERNQRVQNGRTARSSQRNTRRRVSRKD